MSILLDLRTGDPIIQDGDYVRVEDQYAFYQILECLLNCQKGTEVLNPAYGFDLKSAITLNSQGADASFIESITADALDIQKEKLIKSVNFIKAERDGQNMKVRFSATSMEGATAIVEEAISNVV